MKIISFLILNLWMMAGAHHSHEPVFIEAKLHLYYEPSVSSGKVLFEQHCSACHGLDGTKGRYGASNLQASVMTDSEYLRIIQKGKGVMPSWEKKLTQDQIADVVAYLKTWRK